MEPVDVVRVPHKDALGTAPARDASNPGSAKEVYTSQFTWECHWNPTRGAGIYGYG